MTGRYTLRIPDRAGSIHVPSESTFLTLLFVQALASSAQLSNHCSLFLSLFSPSHHVLLIEHNSKTFLLQCLTDNTVCSSSSAFIICGIYAVVISKASLTYLQQFAVVISKASLTRWRQSAVVILKPSLAYLRQSAAVILKSQWLLQATASRLSPISAHIVRHSRFRKSPD